MECCNLLEPGRFHVWLSSATKDTTDLSYVNSVRISLLDKQLEVDPACDKIIHNAGEFPSPYFRADSYMGSFFVSEPGEYNIQIISEKVIAKNAKTSNTSITDDTMLMSVLLTPLSPLAMKRLFYLLILAFLQQISSAQQLPLYSQYLYNKFLINPAVAGSDGFTRL